jgi:hypothetical protein
LAHHRDALLRAFHPDVGHELQRSRLLFDALDDLPRNVLGNQRAAAGRGPCGTDAVVWRGSGPLVNGPRRVPALAAD